MSDTGICKKCGVLHWHLRCPACGKERKDIDDRAPCTCAAGAELELLLHPCPREAAKTRR